MQEKSKKKRLVLTTIIIFIIMPLVIIVGVMLFNDRSYSIISILLAFLACIPFFLSFEKKRPKAREIIIIAVMSAISTVGRFVFAIIPGFKPVTAITVITGISMGPEAGFLTGAMSAIVSNMFFGQGPWTPFQMLTWGLIGYLAGLLGKLNIMQNKIVLSIYGIFSGVVFSLVMDMWVVMSIDNSFNVARYLATVATSLPFMIEYAISNVIFLLVLGRPIGKKLERIKLKYGI